MRKTFLAAGLALAFLAGAAVAQSVVTSNLAGTEFVLGQAGSVGGQSIVMPGYVLRGSEGHLRQATGTTVTTQATNANSIYIATGTITTWNFNLPTSPYSGQRVLITCPGGAVSTLTTTATLPSGVAIVGTNPTACGGASASGVGFTYSVTAKTWYRYF